MKYILETINLTKKYNDKVVLKNVNLKVPEGSIFGLVGKNGAGKTTLMRIVGGLSNCSEGEYLIFDSKPTLKLRENIGMLIEQPGVFLNMTALENLSYFSKLYNCSLEKNDELLKLVGLEKARNKKVQQFSLGMKQRLGIAISLLKNPKILILDEPINGLDPEGVYEIRKLLENLNQNYHTTIIIASHIISKLYKLATDYAIIDEGQLKGQFSKEELEEHCSNNSYIIIDSNEVKKAEALLKKYYPNHTYKIHSNNVINIYNHIELAKLNQLFVNNNINVHGLGINQEDIEKFFVSYLSGGK